MKILMTICGDYISPRFDCTAEVIIATYYNRQLLEESRSIILDHISAERVCDIVLKEQVACIICGGIAEKHYQFLTWKKVQVIDGVIGPHKDVLEAAMEGNLAAGMIFPGVTALGYIA